jgi:hypothetical protein
VPTGLATARRAFVEGDRTPCQRGGGEGIGREAVRQCPAFCFIMYVACSNLNDWRWECRSPGHRLLSRMSWSR